jgi:hypothetical protein
VNLILWVLPPMVAASGIIIIAAIRSVGEEAGRLQREIGEWKVLRPALVELRNETEQARAALSRTSLR